MLIDLDVEAALRQLGRIPNQLGRVTTSKLNATESRNLTQANTEAADVKKEIQAAKRKAEEGSAPPPPPPPPPEEPASGFDPSWLGDSLSKYKVVQPQDGSITMANGIITMRTSNSTGVSISGNPRDEIISPNAWRPGKHAFVGFAVRFPSAAKAGLSLFGPGDHFCLFFQFFGAPANGSPPLKCEVKNNGTTVGWQHNQDPPNAYQMAWERPLRYDDWMNFVYEIDLKEGASTIRTWLDGEKVWDETYDIWQQAYTPGLDARLQQYRRINVYSGVIPFEFKPLAEGISKASVEYR